MNKLKNFLKHSGLVAALVVAPYSLASELTVPNQFSSGDVTSASDVNANFAAIEASVNDNFSRIAALEGQSQGAGARAVFQGFSAGSVNGGAGLIAMQQQCDALVKGSHICTDTEFAKSPYNSQALNLAGEAWVLKELSGASMGDDRYLLTSPLSLNISSAASNSYLLNYENSSCGGWSEVHSSYKGPRVNSDGQFGSSFCQNHHKVACCK